MGKRVDAASPADLARATEADVRSAYRLILRREPDPEGMANYRQLVDQGLSVDELFHMFIRSDEHLQWRERAQRDDETAVDLGGYQVMVAKSDPDFGVHIVDCKVYEEPVRQVLRDRLAPDDVCLDLGANVGVMTFLAASIVGAGGRVIAVEPNPDNVQLLYRGILLNRCSNVEVLPLAAADRRAVFALSGQSNTELRDAGPADALGRFVQSVALDDLLHDLPRLDLVKMDIEGHEPAALRGMLRLVTAHRPTLLVEFNPSCLERQGANPHAFLVELLELYPRVRAISHFGDDEPFTEAEALFTFWRRRAAEVAATGKLPEGRLHFDLVTEET